MTQRKPGDYVVNAELTDAQRERFVRDCVAAGARDYGDCADFDISAWTDCGDVEAWASSIDDLKDANNVTHEYKGKEMTQPQLMRQIADAMDRNPEGWWREFEHFDRGGVWSPCHSKRDALLPLTDGRKVRPKPRTYTLHAQGMPEPLREEPDMGSEVCFIAPESQCVLRDEWGGAICDYRRLRTGLCYPDEPTAREALEKLTKAMGGGND